VVLTGGSVTDVADAYLMDHSVADRIVVVSSLGSASPTGGAMGVPNGELDPWAETIVAARLRYVQVSAYYDHLADVPAASIPDLPANALGKWIAAKQPMIWPAPITADQVAVAALCIPAFATAIEPVSMASPSAAGAAVGPDLVRDPDGSGWLVTQIKSSAATTLFWELLSATR
jgi:hypothetical protein